MENDLIKEIKNIINELSEMPYGMAYNKKTFPPSADAYARKMDRLIDGLVAIHQCNPQFITINTIENIRSLRENQVNRMIVSHKKNNRYFDFGVDEEMNSISQQIVMHIKF